jgi:peptide chain release factor 1
MSRLPLVEIKEKFADINQKLLEIKDSQEIINLSKEQKRLSEQNELALKIESLEKAIQENEYLLQDPEENDEEMRGLTLEDNEQKKKALEEYEDRLLEYLCPTDPNDENNVILEIRAGAGGDESGLFAGEILRAYSRMAEQLGFKIKIISFSENLIGGYKEVIAEVRGTGAYSWYKFEGGVHRVQRVPATEKQGRVHTSTVSVAVMPLIENNSEFKLDLNEVEIITTTSSGNGGQSVNTTYSAIKVKHLPTGLEAQCQDERNQLQNKEKALMVLASRVYDHYERERLEKETAERRSQVGKADRSEKIRTYNFPQDRLTDHRYNNNWNQLPEVMDGKILDVISDIRKMEAERVIQELN